MKKIILLISTLFISTIARAETLEKSTFEISKSCNISKNVETDELNLADVIELSMCNNPQTRQAWLNTKVGSTAYKRTFAKYYPQISANATYQDSNNEDFTVDPSVEINGKDLSGGLSLNWLLYDFGNREAQVEQTFQTMNSLNFQYNNTLQTVAYNVISAYYNALSSIEELAAVKADEEASKKSFELAFKKFELGMSSKADTLQTETTYIQRQLDTVKQEQAVRLAKANLAKLLGLPPSMDIKLVSSYANTTDELITKSVDEIIDIAMEKRPDLMAKIADVKASYAKVRQASATYFPTISGFASKTWYDEDTELDGIKRDRESDAIGVKISLPIFTGFENTYSLRNAKYSYAAEKEALQQLKQDIELNIVNAYNDYKTSIKSVELATKMLESASENEQVALGSYQAGKGDIISLMEAQSKLVAARKQSISAQYDLYTAKIALLKAAGDLNLKNLGSLK
ncbi:MAG: TolC family protein [Alphaproteobacteria bacterium]